jgi:molybdenum cofactor cytidylyltransferase
LIQTRLPGTKESVLDKTVAVTARRIDACGGRLVGEQRCAHAVDALAARIRAVSADLVLIAGASAITDRRDVLPAAIEAAGGVVEHFGMPVDPGNLLLLARLGDRPVLGLPGCARSPKLNGFDWVLQRLAAGLPVGRADIMAMGVGGLLMEIPTRPQPRDGTPARPGVVAAIVLAAGQSRRMGPDNKLLALVDGRPIRVTEADCLPYAELYSPNKAEQRVQRPRSCGAKDRDDESGLRAELDRMSAAAPLLDLLMPSRRCGGT